MNPKIFLVIVAAAILVGLAAHPAQAQLDFPLPFRKKVDADKEKTYWLNERDGPWLIMCASFIGENGMRQANDLVHELRSEHKLKAYVYKKHFDYGETFEGVGWEAYEASDGETKLRHPQMEALHDNDFEEIAVMVGDFPTIDDKRGQKILEKLKVVRPESLEVSETSETNQRMAIVRQIQRQFWGDDEMKKKGQMSKAFMTPNPLLPQSFFTKQRVDRVILDLNKGIKYSLLKCPDDYSVRVATFRGESTFELAKIDEQKADDSRLLKLGKGRSTSKLAEAGSNAQRLTAELRKLGIEAYEFHDRHESFVCVGSFDWLKRKDGNGKEVLNEAILKVMKDYQGSVESFPGASNAMRPKTIPALRGTGIVFDVQPFPVQVPKLTF